MRKAVWLILGMLLVLSRCAGGTERFPFEYPSAILDLYDADGRCWTGMDAAGTFPMPVTPEAWLVGPPPSSQSAVTLPMDHWIDLAFSGRIADGDGNDILVSETGRAGERALLFVTDGAEQEYLLNEVVIDNSGVQDLSHIGIDLAGVKLPFVPRAVRLVSLDFGGQAPGFDLSEVRARVSHDCTLTPCCPNPVSGAAGVSPYTKLTWTPAASTTRPVVYFGAEAAAAAVRYVLQPADVNSFVPPALGLGRTYYWRVDDATGTDANTVRVGDLWCFTVTDRLTIDDFETYDLYQHSLDATWQTHGWAGMSLEQGVAASCRQALAFSFNYGPAWSSEVVRVFDPPQDWSRPQAQVLEIMLRGAGTNFGDGSRLYVTLADGGGEQSVAYADDRSVLTDPRWCAWRIPLVQFDRIDLTHVTHMAIGLPATPDGPPDGGAGTIFLDDIVLRPALCLQGGGAVESVEGYAPADLTADCTVDYRDLQRLAKDWLRDCSRVLAVAAPNDPILWYDFEGDAKDLAGGPEGQILGRCNFVPGVFGWAIDFSSPGDSVLVPEAGNVFSRTRTAITIAFWQRGDDSLHRNNTICCSNYTYGESNPALAIHLGCWRAPGQYRWDCGSPWSFENRVAGRHRDKSEWAGRWNHWAFTKDVRQGRMAIYLNGELHDRREGTDTPLTGITSFEIGDGWYGRYDGAIDDFQIYDYALSPAEIAYVATAGTGTLPQSPDSPADLNGDGVVNLADLALLAGQWLRNDLWP